MRKGFTLIELVIVVGVVITLAGMLMMSSRNTIAAANATRIINDLHVMRTAVLAWYRDNRDKVITTDTSTGHAGMLNLHNGKKQINPIQEVGDKYLHLSDYLEDLGGSGINLTTQEDRTGGGTSTLLQPGYYGVCDGGTETIDEKKYYHRNVWYVGYRFKDNEDAVREKIRARLKSNAGMRLGTGDAHVDYGRSNEEAVWLKVLEL